MYRPWIFNEDILNAGIPSPYPQLTWSGRGRSLLVHWETNFAPIQRFDIGFDDALAGLVAIDESTYASTRDYGLPGPDEFDGTDFAALPWFVWKEEDSTRASLYGDLGSITYRKIDSYFFYGGDVVLLIDVADCVPRISVV